MKCSVYLALALALLASRANGQAFNIDFGVPGAGPPATYAGAGLPGLPQVRLRANSPGGLREGWIQMDGQKQAYVAWGGRQDGTLNSPLTDGGHDLTIKVETLSGIEIIDARRLTGE